MKRGKFLKVYLLNIFFESVCFKSFRIYEFCKFYSILPLIHIDHVLSTSSSYVFVYQWPVPLNW